MKGRGSEVRRPKAIDSRVSQTAYNYQKNKQLYTNKPMKCHSGRTIHGIYYQNTSI